MRNKAVMQWEVSSQPVAYEAALARMQAHVKAVQAGEARELAWLLEHPPVYTAGTSAKREDLLGNKAIPVFETGRGGRYTYHGPGQRVGYFLLNLKKRAEVKGKAPDLRLYVQQLEEMVICALKIFGVEGFIREGRVGVWVNTPAGEAKIAALGVRVQRWVTSHGIALNVHPDLTHYNGIVPCGIRDFGVTSLQDLGVQADMAAVDAALQQSFVQIFEAGG